MSRNSPAVVTIVGPRLNPRCQKGEVMSTAFAQPRLSSDIATVLLTDEPDSEISRNKRRLIVKRLLGRIALLNGSAAPEEENEAIWTGILLGLIRGPEDHSAPDPVHNNLADFEIYIRQRITDQIVH